MCIQTVKAGYISARQITDLSRVVQTEDVVEDVVGVSLRDQVEDLGEALRVGLVVDEEVAGDHDEDVAALGGWLGVEGGDAVGDLLERQGDELLDDALGTLHLTGLEGQHRLVPVEVAELGSVGVKLVVVELGELLREGVEVHGVGRK